MAMQEQMMGGGKGIPVGGGKEGWRDQAREQGSRQLQEPRPGHSDMVYMQHRYTPLDLRIIIITAAIFILLLCILFLNFFIRWALRRFALMRADHPNKGLSKRQVQALPTFIYCSSRPIIGPSAPCTFSPYLVKPPTPCHDKNFLHLLMPTLTTPHALHNIKFCPSNLHDSSQVGDSHSHNTKIASSNIDASSSLTPLITPSANKVDINVPLSNVDHSPTFDQSSSQAMVDELHQTDRLTKLDSLDSPDPLRSPHIDKVQCGKSDSLDSLDPFSSPHIDEAQHGNNPPNNKDKVVSSAKPLTCLTKINLQSEKRELIKANLAISRGDHPIVGHDKVDHLCNYGHENANSAILCPICLAHYTDGDIIRVLPLCKHYFHITCIDLWLARSSSCPACRSNILEATQTLVKQPNLQVQVIITTTND